MNADYGRLVVYTGAMKTTITYRLFTVVTYVVTALFIALVANGLYHSHASGVDLFTWAVYYGIYIYSFLIYGREALPNVPVRVAITTMFVMATVLAHLVLSSAAAIITAVAAPVAAVALLKLFTYVVTGNK